MKRITVFLAIAAMTTAPAVAQEAVEVGKIEASFDGKTIVQPTVHALEGGKQVPGTAHMVVQPPMSSSLSIQGHRPGDGQLGLEVNFMTLQPGPKTAPSLVAVTYKPKEPGQFWTSEDTPTLPSVTFTTLETKDEGKARAVGTFKAQLCFSKGYDQPVDTGNCRPITGRFDTRVFVEKL